MKMESTHTFGNHVQNLQKHIPEMHTGLFVSSEKCTILIRVVKRMLEQKYSTRAVSGPWQPRSLLVRVVHCLIEMHTGLFVSSEKCTILIRVVKRMLEQKYSTRAVSGPWQPNGNCEILLQPIHNPTTGVNFPGSKKILEIYLNMLKESRPNFVYEKQPEVISIEDDDEDNVGPDNMKSDSVVFVDERFDNSSCIEVIDVDHLEDKSFQKSSSFCKAEEQQDEKKADASSSLPEPKVSVDEDDDDCVEQTSSSSNERFSDEIIVIDSVKKNNSKNMSLEDSDSSTSKTESSGVKRKVIEVVNIEDDEIIELDDSFPQPKHLKASSCSSSYQNIENHTVKVKEDTRTFLANISKDSVINFGATRYENHSSSSSINTNSLLPINVISLNDVVNHPTRTDNTEKSDGHANNAMNINNSKKPSKFAYKRIGHLVTPLTAKVTSSNEDINKSSSGMSNIYNPNANLQEKRTGLRPIVIDGNNVGVSHGKGQFSVKGIQICINYFEKRGHRQIKAFIPQYRRRKDVHDILDRMERQGTVVITPSRRVEGKTVAPYDDRYIVQYAAEVGGVIVTTDNYRDLMAENPSWRHTIEQRLLMFSWVDDLLMFPQDPMGRNGPNLDDFLKFPD